MAVRSSITVGHHEYSAQDARKTIENISTIWSYFIHDSHIPDGWLAGARGFIAEMASLGGISLPSLDNVDSAMNHLTELLTNAYPRYDAPQIESLLAAMWRFFPTMRLLNIEHVGTVSHLHASKGLPKKPIDVATITWRGVDGDVQRSRALHGRPWQALCLWSTDAIDALKAQGHPIEPGYAGENITVSGIPATAFRPGAHFRCGGVRGFFTAYTIPCSQNNQWFAKKNISSMHHEQGPYSRIYAMVTQTGHISVGDSFELFSDR